MAQIRPFAGIHYARRRDLEFSRLIAPPYDVLDEKDKSELQARHPNNIVNVDLPHLPPKTAGPDQAYQAANITLQAWLSAGVLMRDPRATIYPYAQSFEHHGRTYHRRGLIAAVRLSAFGQGQVIPHEKTYKGPIEDRLKLMRATRMQISPIFGLFSDPRNELSRLLYGSLAKPAFSGSLDGVQHDLWTVTDGEVENQVIDLLKHRPVYIADGHHRYTTALQYQQELEQLSGGPLPAAHPANWCMFVLVGLQDDGLLILPTHRLLGGLQNFDIKAFKSSIGQDFDVLETPLGPQGMQELADALNDEPPHTFGLYDGTSQKLYLLRLRNPDILQPLEPNQSDAWRRLDVAILQRYLLDEVIQPKFSGGKELKKGYTADAQQMAAKVDGRECQIALLLKPTPLHALEELGQHGEVMPQKSTYFYPKVATGAVLYPLE